MHNQWRVQCKFVVYFFKLRLASCDSDALRATATAHAQNVGGQAKKVHYQIKQLK
jgi:hypothetical protein